MCHTSVSVGMADGGEEAAAAGRVSEGGGSAAGSATEHLEEYRHLLELGLDTRVAGKLEEIYRTGALCLMCPQLAFGAWFLLVQLLPAGKLVHSELDDRALDALKEFPVDGAQSVLQQFLESNLEHVSNKSAFLCGIMKTYR